MDDNNVFYFYTCILSTGTTLFKGVDNEMYND